MLQSPVPVLMQLYNDRCGTQMLVCFHSNVLSGLLLIDFDKIPELATKRRQRFARTGGPVGNSGQVDMQLIHDLPLCHMI